MYCAIKDFKDYDFLGDLSTIKENIVDYTTDMEKLLEISKGDINIVVRLPYSDELEVNDIEMLRMLSDARENIRFMVQDKLIEGLPCFFKYGFMSADSLDRMDTLCRMGVTDVYVTGELGFKMELARTKADEYGVKIRVVPNIVQLSGIGFTLVPEQEHINSFWIRPEDLPLYEKYIDVIEFIGDTEKQHIFHKIYFIDKRWKVNLAIIIAGLEEVYGMNISNEFAKARLNCGKKCVSNQCHTCFKIKALSQLATEKGLDMSKEENLI